MVSPGRGFVDWVSDEVDVGGRLSVELAKVQEVHVSVKGHRNCFITNSLSDLLDQFLLRRHKIYLTSLLKVPEPVSALAVSKGTK